MFAAKNINASDRILYFSVNEFLYTLYAYADSMRCGYKTNVASVSTLCCRVIFAHLMVTRDNDSETRVVEINT